jgi:hypothetical protein
LVRPVNFVTEASVKVKTSTVLFATNWLMCAQIREFVDATSDPIINIVENFLRFNLQEFVLLKQVTSRAGFAVSITLPIAETLNEKKYGLVK